MSRALGGALASAVLFGFAARLQAPSQVAALLALAPWMIASERAGTRAALAAAALLASAMSAACFYWLPPALAGYTGVSLPVAWAAMLMLAPLVLEPQFLLATAARLGAPRFKPAVFIAAYLAADWAAPKLLGDTLGLGLHPDPWLRQFAELGGVLLLTLLCLCASSVRSGRQAIAALLLLAFAWGFGALRLQAVEEATRRAPVLAVGVVQAAIPSYDKLAAEHGTYQAVRQILDAHFALSAKLSGRVDLLVWPETVYPTTFGAPKSEAGAEFDAEIASRAGAVPLVFGAFEHSDAGEHNAAFVLDRGGFQTYRKSALFPLTEHVPAWLEPLRLPWMGHWQPGDGPRILEARAGSALVHLAPLICYEAVRPGAVAAGADLIVTLSNDGWFPAGAGPRLHLVAAAFRSVETRLPQVRATNSGISALILPSGEIVGALPFGAAAAARYEVPRLAPFVSPWRMRWVGPAALALCGLLLAAGANLRASGERRA